MKTNFWWNRASACWMAVVGIVLTILVTRVSPTTNKLDMSKFASMVENKTCTNYLGGHWHAFGSMFVWEECFRFYVDWRNPAEVPFEARIKPSSESQNKRDHPIYYVNLDQNYDKFRYFINESEQIKYQRIKTKTLFFYPLELKMLLYIFAKDQQDLYIVYHTNSTEPTSKNSKLQPAGFIPLMHLSKEANFDSKSPITFINNRDYSYCSGYLQINPVELKFEHTYYYGFDVNMNTIYFGRKLSYLEKHVVNYVSASVVLANSRWHPFLCHQFVFIVTEQWVLIFPHVRLQVQLQLLNNPAILKTQISLIHINTFFRCTTLLSDSVPFPVYPRSEIVVHLQSVDSNYRFNYAYVWLPSVALLLIAIGGILYYVYIKKRRPLPLFLQRFINKFKIVVEKLGESDKANNDNPNIKNRHKKKLPNAKGNLAPVLSSVSSCNSSPASSSSSSSSSSTSSSVSSNSKFSATSTVISPISKITRSPAKIVSKIMPKISTIVSPRVLPKSGPKISPKILNKKSPKIDKNKTKNK